MTDSLLKQIVDLPSLLYEELKQLWRTLHGKKPPTYTAHTLSTGYRS